MSDSGPIASDLVSHDVADAPTVSTPTIREWHGLLSTTRQANSARSSTTNKLHEPVIFRQVRPDKRVETEASSRQSLFTFRGNELVVETVIDASGNNLHATFNFEGSALLRVEGLVRKDKLLSARDDEVLGKTSLALARFDSWNEVLESVLKLDRDPDAPIVFDKPYTYCLSDSSSVPVLTFGQGHAEERLRGMSLRYRKTGVNVKGYNNLKDPRVTMTVTFSRDWGETV